VFIDSTVTVDLDRLYWPVQSLGHGKRAAIWFQGCGIGCPGCCSPHTWSSHPERTPLAEVLAWLKNLPKDELDGVTISGGEPFDQPEALRALLGELRVDLCGADARRDILVYSGYPWRKLAAGHADILGLIDVLISGPFVEHRPPALLRGSDNQQLHRLTSLAHERYPHPDAPYQPRLEFHLTGGHLQFVGIPRRQDIDRIRARLRAAGITLDDITMAS
jgi:anaerobic ribonucleoside-triphosphate reductase activating protein